MAQTVDPKRSQQAISGLNAGFLAVVATLKLQFAKVCDPAACRMLSVLTDVLLYNPRL